MSLDTSTTYFPGAVVKARQFLYVYAQAGEYILLGSRNRTAANTGAIYVFKPQSFGAKGAETVPATSTAAFTCNSGTVGLITDRNAELAGPRSADNTPNGNRYQACAYQVPTSGIYGVVFGGSSGSTAAKIDPPTTAASAVSAWDITVRSSDPSSTDDLDGRVFTYAWSVSTAGNSTAAITTRDYRIATTLYYVSSDGYRYRQDMRGIDPNGAAFYANSSGFLDTDGAPLYHDFRGANSSVTGGASSNAGITAQAPQYPMFFSDISPTAANAAEVNRVLTALSFPLAPKAPELTAPAFIGNRGNGVTTVSLGGTFSFNVVNTQTYQIVVSRDGVDFDPANPLNRVLTGVAYTGSYSVLWDGKDNSGNAFPAGNYDYQIVGRNGEIHFPMADVEGNVNGGPTLTKLNGPSVGDATVYYDDRGYAAANGTVIGTRNGHICGGTAGASQSQSSPNYSLVGLDSNQILSGSGVSAIYARSWGGSTNANTDCSSTSQFFGDAKGLDLWALEKSAVYKPKIKIEAPSSAVDVVTQVTVTPSVLAGASAYGNFSFGNAGSGTATGVSYAVAIGSLGGAVKTCPAAVTFTMLPVGVTASYNSSTCAVSFKGMPTSLAPGATLLFNFNYVVATSNPGPIPITTSVSAVNESTDGSATAPNDASAVTVVATPLISVSKVATPGSGSTVKVGDSITYVLAVDVSSAPLISSLTLSDTLGAGLQFGAVVSNSPALICSGGLSCSLPAGAATGTYSVTYTAVVTAAAGDQVWNAVTAVGGSNTPPVCDPCSVSHPVVKTRLTVAKSLTGRVVTTDQFEVSISHGGPTAVTAVAASTVSTGRFDATPGTSYTLSETAAAGADLTLYNSSFSCTNRFSGGSAVPAGASGTSLVVTPQAGDDILCTFTNSPRLADLSIQKTATPENTYTEGASLDYSIVVSNAGPMDVTGVSVRDQVPSSVSVASWTCTAGAGADCDSTVSGTGASGASGNITLANVSLQSGASITISIKGTVLIGTTGNIQNTATVSPPVGVTCLAAPCSKSSTTTNGNAGQPMLGIQKTATPTAFARDQSGTYSILVSNTGGATTTGVITVSDEMPAGLLITAVPNTGWWTCTGVGTSTLSCASSGGAALVPGANAPVINVQVKVPASFSTVSVSNTASVAGGGSSCSSVTPCEDTVTTPINSPRIEVSKVLIGALVSGGSAKYRITVTNSGQAPTLAGTITDEIPEGLSVGTLPNACTKAGQIVTCAVAANLQPGASVSFDVGVNVLLNMDGKMLRNIAKASPNLGDLSCPVEAHCAGSTDNPVTAPELKLSKSASSSALTVGVAATYTLSLTNTGTAPTTSPVTITDVVPDKLTIDASTLPAACSLQPANSQTVVCTVAANFAQGAAPEVFSFTVTPQGDLGGISVTNKAKATGGGDPLCTADMTLKTLPGRCAPSVITPVQAPRLTLLKTTNPTAFAVGVPGKYILTVTNEGSAPTSGKIIVTDLVPTTLGLGAMPGCTAVGQQVTCETSDILGAASSSATSSVSFEIEVTPSANAAPAVLNSASVQGGGDPVCPMAPNCLSSVTTPVNAPSLELTKQDNGPWTIGQANAVYTLTVKNASAQAATSGVMTVTDTMPAGLTPDWTGVLAVGKAWTCSFNQQDVVCTSAKGFILPTGASDDIPLPVVVGAAAITPVNAVANTALVTNRAQVGGGGDPFNDGVPPDQSQCVLDGSHCASVTTKVGQSPKLLIEKTLLETAVAGGTDVVYTVTLTNLGGSHASAVSWTDTPVNAQVVQITPYPAVAGAGTCVGSVCSNINIPAGGSFVYRVTALITGAAGSVAVNVVNAEGGGCTAGSPSTPASCTARVETPITAAPAISLVKRGPATADAKDASIDYTLELTNRGAVASGGLLFVRDQLPAGMTVTSVSGADCGVLPSSPGAMLECQVVGPLAGNGGTQSFTITATLPSKGTSGTNYASTHPSGARVPGVDPGPGCSDGNDVVCAKATTTLVAVPELPDPELPDPVVEKTNNADSVTEGATITYTITLSNPGTTDAPGVSMTDTVVSGLTDVKIINSTTTNGSIAGNCSGLSCTGVTVTGGGSVIYTVSAKVSGKSGEYAQNTAVVIGGACLPQQPCTSTDRDPIVSAVPTETTPVPMDSRTMLVLLSMALAAMAYRSVRTRHFKPAARGGTR